MKRHVRIVLESVPRLLGWPLLKALFVRHRAGRAAYVADVCRRAAAGDMEARIAGADARSDFGRMCKAINDLLDLTDCFAREAGAAMENCSQDRFHRPILTRGLKGRFRESAAVINQAGLKMKEASEARDFVNQQSIANAGNVHRVAAACEELSATATEILGQARQTERGTDGAVRGVNQASTALVELTEAVAKIGRVVDVINHVALQTNLLALNASIEAAHAGQQGQGFAVVAGEVKNLSEETRKATDQISSEMAHVQSTVAVVAEMIRSIQAAIQTAHESSAAIAISVQEQVRATEEINRTILEVSASSEEISRRINAGRDAGALSVSP